MKIIILGAGQVGGTLAENLANEQNDITVIDTDAQRLRELQDLIDIKTVVGTGSYPQVLRQAGADDADMLIAVTNSDETNMVACQVAYTLFRTPTKISRIRSNAYLKQKELFKSDAFPIDVLISPEQVVTNYIKRLLEYPGTLQVLDFADEKVQLVAVRAYHGGLLVGQQLRKLREHMPTADTKVAAIYRRGQAILPTADTVIEVDDEVFFIAAKNHIKKVMNELRREENSYKRILIAGGGNIGYRLAKALENKYRIKLIEHGEKRAQFLSENLSKTVVLMGSATDQALLEEENIENIDVFCAVTNDDESNIMSSMLAKRLGARKVMTLINKAAYVDLVQGGVIDVAISPQQTTIGSLLTHVRRGDVVNVHSLRRGAAEAIEAIAHGDKLTSKVVGRTIADIDLPKGTTIGAIVRGDQVIIAHENVMVESDDHIILFVVDKRRIPEVERLFQVGLGFF
ncbi:Potassium uptake protein [Oleispira antarctica RB-8]|uniref:Trk system potassium uptake protein TrkA n=1 Tax=Oleispira antarctica RB-8 TaxID=698738 RepID=R4YM86_OLEAN|nr:Potassium uptake protein [Oleispira antarctica RB-8]